MKTIKTTGTEKTESESSVQKTNIENNISEHNTKRIPIEFYISLVSITAFFTLLTLDILQKKERIELAQIGYIQKLENKNLDLDSLRNFGSEGVPLLKPFLFDTDPIIRQQAIESIKQINTPEAASALREAAKKVKDLRERISMLEAAKFVELPIYEPNQQ
jgi:hypothetical protein